MDPGLGDLRTQGRGSVDLKKSAQAGVGALILVLGGVLAVRAGRDTPALSPSPAESPKPPPSAAAPVPALGDLGGSTTGSLALRWTAALAKAQEKSRPSATDLELLRSEDGEFAQEMKKRLAQDPARWTDVLDVLSQEDPRLGRKIVAALKDGVTNAAEPMLIRALKEGAHREIRISSATLLAERPSNEALWALVTSAQEDSDSGVRQKSLSELAARQGRAGTPTETAMIDEFLRQRARLDPDAGVRQYALRATGQVQEIRPSSPTPSDRGLLRRD